MNLIKDENQQQQTHLIMYGDNLEVLKQHCLNLTVQEMVAQISHMQRDKDHLLLMGSEKIVMIINDLIIPTDIGMLPKKIESENQ
jgi:hypothetical protein